MMKSQQKANLLERKIPLNQCHLYGIKSPNVLAVRLGVGKEKLQRLADENNYNVFKIKTGRLVQEPSKELQNLHRKIHRYLSRVDAPAYLHSTVRGTSYVSNARAHLGTGVTAKIDVKSFFPSVPQHKVMHFFRDQLKCAGDVAGLLANLICYNGFLATGSAASPIISYYSYKTMFDEMDNLANSIGATFTVYVDDITISGSGVNWMTMQKMRSIIRMNGLFGHKAKISRANVPRIITGVVVNGHSLQLPFARWRKMKNQMKEIDNLSDGSDKIAALNRLVSSLYEAAQIDPTCRKMAEFHHAQLRQMKSRLAA